MSWDSLVAVIVAALGSPLILQAAKGAVAAWRGRARKDDQLVEWRRKALEWEMTTWETRAVAIRHGVPRNDLPKGPGEHERKDQGEGTQ